jgi:hypothetical protein
MHTELTNVFFIPTLPHAKVIVMPKNMRARVRLHQSAEILDVRPCRHGSYDAAKEVVVRWCRRHQLTQGQIDLCIGLFAREVARGRSKATAINQAISVGKGLVSRRSDLGGDAA